MNTLKAYWGSPKGAETDGNVIESEGGGEGVKRPLSNGSISDSLPASKKLLADFDKSTSFTDVQFEDGTPHRVPLMFQSMQALSAQVAEVADRMVTIESNLTKRVVECEKAVEFVTAKFDEQQKSVKSLSDRLEKVESENKRLLKQVDKNEQHSRNECLLIHGAPEPADGAGGYGEDCAQLFASIVTANVGVQLTKADIKRAHRLGKVPANGKPRPIIARFKLMHKRNEVYSNKKKLKGQKLLITENLTQLRVDALKSARAKYGDRKVWTTEGRIYAKDENDKKVTIFV